MVAFRRLFPLLLAVGLGYASSASQSVVTDATTPGSGGDHKNGKVQAMLPPSGIDMTTLSLEELNTHLQECPIISSLNDHLHSIAPPPSSLESIFHIIFPSSHPGVNALLATLYISGPPNLLLALCPTDIDPSSLKVMVAFAVGGLMGDTLFHLLPEIFLGEPEDDKAKLVLVEPNRNLLLGAMILVGFTTFVAMDKGIRIATGGVGGHDHGHGHAHSHASGSGEDKPAGAEAEASGAKAKVQNGELKNRSKKTAGMGKLVESGEDVTKDAVSNPSIKIGGYLNMISPPVWDYDLRVLAYQINNTVLVSITDVRLASIIACAGVEYLVQFSGPRTPNPLRETLLLSNECGVDLHVLLIFPYPVLGNAARLGKLSGFVSLLAEVWNANVSLLLTTIHLPAWTPPVPEPFICADFTHNITDGLAMAASFYASPVVGATTTVAVFFHEIPHEVGDFALLVQSGFTKWQAMGAQFVTAIGALLGTLIGIAIQEYGGASRSKDEDGAGMPMNSGLMGTSLIWGDLLLPFTAGTFLYVATVAVIPELLETDGKRGEVARTVVQFAAVAAGAGIMLWISWH
ncbi:hypothetical protein MKZ38_009646 [Zalerion maritima]|uniref:Uncharacterized protein n=1 Tax=Zalerion maritima TaxID=339359 RepID=A0AAD5RT35_9PEZI|nr:hypothetical protein MKZ38_009646 [Zalerion maritima]